MAAIDIITPFSVSSFNKLSDYHDVRCYGDADKKLVDMVDVINAFGDVYCDHNKESNAGLSLSHRHFDLRPGEKKVAKQIGDTLVRIQAMDEESVDSSKKMLPYLFNPVRDEVNDTIRLVPLEYVVHDNPEHAAALERDIEAICDPAFLRDFMAVAESENVQGLYGIFLRSRHFLSYHGGTDFSTLEGSGEGDRTLEVKVVPRSDLTKEPDCTTVGWCFRKDGASGKVVPLSACSALGHGKKDADPKAGCSVHPRCVRHGCNHKCRHGCHPHNSCQVHYKADLETDEEDVKKVV